MILHLTDSTEIRRSLAAALREGDEIRTLPSRLTTAAAATGRAIERCAPDVVIVSTLLLDGRPDETCIVYRLEVAGEIWVPDVPFDHDEEAVSVVAGTPGSGEPPRATAGQATVRSVSTASAVALAAAIALLSPAQVVGLAAGADALTRLGERAAEIGRNVVAITARTRRTVQGDETVTQSVRLGDGIADRLRLTATQRARFLQAVRSAAVRGGTVPAPLQSGDASTASTKEEAKRRLAELEQQLREWKRGED